MIVVPFPHMVLNSHSDTLGEEYEMLFTWKVPKSTSVKQMVSRIRTNAKVCKKTMGTRLQTLILNAHGEPGKIKLGQYITRNDVREFRRLRGLVKRIWIVACEVAMIKKAGTITDGNWFCYRLAQEARAKVKASGAVQYSYPNLYVVDFVPWGFIDDWEQPVYRWNRKGKRY